MFEQNKQTSAKKSTKFVKKTKYKCNNCLKQAKGEYNIYAMEKYSIYIIGAICGLSYGAFVGFCKYVVLWMKLAKSSKKQIASQSITARIFGGIIINIVALAATLLFKNSEVLDFSALAIGTAFSLSVTARLFSVKNIIAEKQVIDDIGGKK